MQILKRIYQIVDKIPYSKKIGPKNILLIFSSIILFVFVIVIFSHKPAESSNNFNTAFVKKGDFEVSLVESGEIEAESQVFINAPSIYGVNLQIIELVPEGTIVKKGDFVIQFDASALEDQKTLREETLQSLKADLEKMKSQHKLTISNLKNNLQIARYSYEQAKLNLKIRQYESESSKEEARLQLKQAEIELEKSGKQLESQKIINKSQIIKMMSSIKQAENRLNTVKESIKKCTVLSPANGMIVYQEVGSWRSRERLRVGYNARRGESLISIPDMSRMMVKFFVNEIDRLKIKQGMKIKAYLEAYPDSVLLGKVTSVSQLAQPVNWGSNLKEFLVYAKLDTVIKILKPGMSVQVSVLLNNYHNVTYVPTGAVFEYKGQQVVFPVKKRKPYVIYTGERNDGLIIVNRGVKPGTEILFEPPLQEAALLGFAEEEKRIERIKEIMSGSFDVFKKLGILYEYSSEKGENGNKKKTPRLPSFLKKRLEKSGSIKNSGQTDTDQTNVTKQEKLKSFNLSPEMRKKLKKKKTPNNKIE